MKLHATNLSPKLTEQRLKEIFEQFGHVFMVDLHLKRQFGHNCGAAVVEMNCAEAMQAARALNGHVVHHRRMYICVVR